MKNEPNGKNHFTATMEYNDDTIRRMFRTEYYTYETLQRMLRLGIGVAALLAAFFVKLALAPQILCLMVGVWLIVAGDFPSKIQAEGVIAKRGGQTSKVILRFDDNSVHIENGVRIPYKELDKLVEDNDYLYFFKDRQNAVMVPCAALAPEQTEALKNLAARKSGKTFAPVHVGILEFNLKDVIRLMDRRRKAKPQKS